MAEKIKTCENYPFLLAQFIEAMNDIGRYGEEKYKEHSFFQRALNGDRSRGELVSDRTSPIKLRDHAVIHFDMYLNHETHDHFNDDIHQLAAVAFNAMMEAYFAGLCEDSNELPRP